MNADLFSADDNDRITVCESNLSLIEDKLTHIKERAQFYNEYSLTKLDFIDMIEQLQLMARALRRSSHG